MITFVNETHTGTRFRIARMNPDGKNIVIDSLVDGEFTDRATIHTVGWLAYEATTLAGGYTATAESPCLHVVVNKTTRMVTVGNRWPAPLLATTDGELTGTSFVDVADHTLECIGYTRVGNWWAAGCESVTTQVVPRRESDVPTLFTIIAGPAFDRAARLIGDVLARNDTAVDRETFVQDRFHLAEYPLGRGYLGHLRAMESRPYWRQIRDAIGSLRYARTLAVNGETEAAIGVLLRICALMEPLTRPGVPA